MIYTLHFKYFPIDFYGESIPSRRVSITYDAFYPGNPDTAVQYKDVGSYFTSLI